jgi:hypothetical protein
MLSPGPDARNPDESVKSGLRGNESPPKEGTDLPEVPAIELYIDPGDASKEAIQEVLESLSELHRAAGGLGLKFRADGLFVIATEEVTR